MKNKEDIILKLIENNTECLKLLNEIEGEEKYTWALSVVGNILHDVPEEYRKRFFDSYEALRAEVVEYMS